MASVSSVSSVSLPKQGQHSFRFYWSLCSSTLNHLAGYCTVASGKIKAVYKQVQGQEEDQKIEDKVSEVTEINKICSVEELNNYSLIADTCKTNIFNDTMPEKGENIWNKDTANLFPNVDKLASQNNEEDMLSIVESIVTAKLEAEFCLNKEHKEQSSTGDNTEDIIQDPACTNLSNLQKTDGNKEELKLTKHSDGNNNDSKSVIPCMSKADNKQDATCKISGAESSKASMEAKDKDVHVKTNYTPKTSIRAGSNTNLIKDNEKSSSSDSKKAIFNSKSSSAIDRGGRDHFNKYNARNIPCIKKQEFGRQRNVSRNGIEKETRIVTAKPNLMKTGSDTADTTCQNKNLNKDKGSQKQQQMKQFASKLKGQEPFKKTTSTLNFSNDDKNKIEKATRTPEDFKPSLNEFERKNEKIVSERNVQSDQKANRVDFRKNTFVTQYRNSTFSKPMQSPRTGQAPMYGKNSSYTYNNPKFNRTCNTERSVVKKEDTSTNNLNIKTEELATNNLASYTTQKKETIHPTNVKSTNVHEVDTLVFNDKNDINPVKVETHLIKRENMNLSVDCTEQGPTSEQCCKEMNDNSKVDNQQRKGTDNEEIDPLKRSSNLASDKCTTDSQANAMYQYSSELENVQQTSVNQLESSRTWNQLSDNAVQKGATTMSLQQSIKNMHFNTQQTFTQAENPTRQVSSWEPDNSKFYDEHFSVNNTMRLSQIPNTWNLNAPPYEYKAQMSNDNNVISTSTLETTMNSNRESSNALYRYGSNIQQRPVMASDFPGHSMSQTNQARCSVSIQDGFHVEHSYVATQPTMMHIYNPTAFDPDDFNMHTMDYIPHPVIYAPSPYMQTWNSQLQYPMPVVYNSPYTNYTTFPHNSQSNNFNNSMPDQQHKHNPYMQMNSYARDTYSDTNSYAVQARNAVDSVPIKSNYYYKRYQDNSRTAYDVPQYVPVSPVPYSRSQQGMNFMPAAGINQHNASYCSPNQRYKHKVTNYMKNPQDQMQDFAFDDNTSEDTPPIISPKEFVTNNTNFPNQTEQFAARVFKPEFKTKSSFGCHSPFSSPRYSGSFRRNTTFQDFSKEYTYPSIGRGTYKTKRT